MHSKDALLLALNAVLFNVAWLLCVIGGDQIAILTAMVLLAIHLSLVANAYQEVFFIAGIAVLGYAIDSVLFASEILIGETPLVAIGNASFSLAPLWLFALWFCFSTTLNHCFRFLHQRIPLAVLLGAFAGTTSYLAGIRLSGVEMGGSFIQVTLTLVIIWGVLFPSLMVAAKHFSQKYPREA